MSRNYFDALTESERVPNSARVWNYWLGGKDHYLVDRQAAEEWFKIDPMMRMNAMEGRKFLIRAVRYLAGEAGVSQFLDIGTGLPNMQNTHEVAQASVPDARVVYVDNDPTVLAHARALLTAATSTGATAYVSADVHDPEGILSEAEKTLDFERPIAVMFLGVLGHIAEHDRVRSIASRLMSAVLRGSHLVIRDGTRRSEAMVSASEQYADTGAVAYHLRSIEQLHEYFSGLQMVSPGLVPVSMWRPENGGQPERQSVNSYAGLGLKN